MIRKKLTIENRMIKEMERLYLVYGFSPNDSKSLAEKSYDIYKLAEIQIMDEEYSCNSQL